MANSNFVVHNGLTVGPLSIDAATGDITTAGNLTVTGPLGTNKISTGASNVATTANYVNVAVNGTNVAAFTSTGIVLPNNANIQIGTQYVNHTNAPFDVSVAANSFVQINIQNIDSVGTQVSADFVATAVDGTDTSKFIDMGINGNLFVSPGGTWTISGANDGYVYIDGGNLTLGTATAGKTVRIHTGGLLSTNVVAEYYAANVTMIGNVNPSTSNLFTLGSTTNWWNKAFTVSATAQYADLAENYAGDASYAAGTVVDFGGTHEITLCDSDMSSRVAGVVSTNPAYLMNGTQTGENIVAVALTGRVPTKVRGPIRKGDLIVSAGDGHARAENLPQVGTVIGKALEDFDGDAGVIEVVVGKH